MYFIKTKVCFLIFFSIIKANFSDTLSYYQKFEIALESYQKGRFKLAQNQFSDILRSKDNKDPTSRIMIAKSMYSQKKYDKAINIIEKIILNLDDTPYGIHARLLLADIYLSQGNNTTAFKNYLIIRAGVRDSIYLNEIDKRLVLCISNGLNENQLENILIREKNISNKSIINLSRAYQAWLNGDLYSLKNALDGINNSYLGRSYSHVYQRLKEIKKNTSLTPIITIAVILPLSGSEKQKGQSYLMGLSDYLKNLKTNSFIRFKIFNTEGNSINSLRIIRNIKENSLIRGIIGPILKEEILAVSGFNSSIPILIPNSGPFGLAEISPNLFFLLPSPKTISERTAQIMINFFGFKNIAVLSPADKESKKITDYFLNECNQLGINPVAVEWYLEKPENISKQFKNIRKAAWGLVPDEKSNSGLSMDIDSIDALFDVDVTDFFSFPEKEDTMDKKDSIKIILETIEAFYIPIRKGELTYIGTQYPIYNLKTTIFGNQNWLDMDVLNQEAIGPHVQGLKIISSTSSELLINNYNLYINYYALAKDHANFLESNINKRFNNKKKYSLDIRKSKVFNGENISILFQGDNKNTNGAVQVLEYKDVLNNLGYYDGLNIVKTIE